MGWPSSIDDPRPGLKRHAERHGDAQNLFVLAFRRDHHRPDDRLAGLQAPAFAGEADLLGVGLRARLADLGPGSVEELRLLSLRLLSAGAGAAFSCAFGCALGWALGCALGSGLLRQRRKARVQIAASPTAVITTNVRRSTGAANDPECFISLPIAAFGDAAARVPECPPFRPRRGTPGRGLAPAPDGASPAAKAFG